MGVGGDERSFIVCFLQVLGGKALSVEVLAIEILVIEIGAARQRLHDRRGEVGPTADGGFGLGLDQGVDVVLWGGPSMQPSRNGAEVMEARREIGDRLET